MVFLLSLSPFWLLFLLLDCRAFLFRRGLGWSCSLNRFASLLRRLWAWGGWTALLDRRRIRTLGILLCGTSHLRCSWLFTLSRRGRSLPCLLLIVLLHYGLTRLVTVVLALKLLLLHHWGIAVP